jgi:hypothetical protein
MTGQLVSCFVSDPDPDPDWNGIQLGQWIRIRIRNSDPDSESGSESGSRMTKMTHKNKELRNLMFSSVECFLFRDEGFSCSLDVLF